MLKVFPIQSWSWYFKFIIFCVFPCIVGAKIWWSNLFVTSFYIFLSKILSNNIWASDVLLPILCYMFDEFVILLRTLLVNIKSFQINCSCLVVQELLAIFEAFLLVLILWVFTFLFFIKANNFFDNFNYFIKVFFFNNSIN